MAMLGICAGGRVWRGFGEGRLLFSGGKGCCLCRGLGRGLLVISLWDFLLLVEIVGRGMDRCSRGDA